MTRNIVVFDDNPDLHRWAKDLKRLLASEASRYEVVPATPTEFDAVFSALVDRSHNGVAGAPDSQLKLVNDGSILVVDNDINPVGDDAPVRLKGKSGRRFAALARHFSDASAVIVVNTRYSRPTFDLTGPGFEGSLADFHVDGESLTSNLAFWRRANEDSSPGFRPIHWPGALDLVESVESWIVANSAALEEPNFLDNIVPTILGLDPFDDPLTVKQFEAFWPNGLEMDLDSGNPSGLTVASLLGSDRASSLGPDVEANQAPRAMRAIAYTLSRVSRHLVLPPQNVWLDAWHAVKMFGSDAGVDGPDAANSVARQLDSRETGTSSDSFPQPAPDASALVGRPVYSASDFGTQATAIGFPLCEDTSRFVQNESLATPYDPRDSGPLARRYIDHRSVRNSRWDVTPRVRLLG